MIDLIPRPKEIRNTGKKITGTDLVLVNSRADSSISQLFTECRTEILGRKPDSRSTAGPTIALRVFKGFREFPSGIFSALKRSTEAYVLKISSKDARLYSRSYRGLVYGIHTLLALAEAKRGAISLPVCTIGDWPDFTMRGAQDDPARGQVSTVDNFKRIIRELSRLKYNLFTFHMEDMIRFDKHPDIGKDFGALYKSEWRELFEYGKLYGLELFPTFQFFGHAARVMHLPKYRKYGDIVNGKGYNYSPAAPGLYNLFEDFMNEIHEVFDGDTIHIGCDEVAPSLLEKGQSKHLVQKHGFLKVYMDHVLKVTAMAKKRWKNVLFFADIFKRGSRVPIGAGPEQVRRLHKAGLGFVNWNYYDYCDVDYFNMINLFKRCGVRQITCPAIWDWGQIFPSYSEMSRTLPVFTDLSYREGVKEAITSSWGDVYGGGAFREDNYLNYAFSAEHLWNAGICPDSQEQFTTRWARQFFGAAPKNLVDALVWLGNLNPLVYDSAKHDNRVPDINRWHKFIAFFVFWNYPLPGSGLAEDFSKSKQKAAEANSWLDPISSIKNSVKRNKFNIDLIAYGLKRSRWLFESVQYSAKPAPAKARRLARDLKTLAKEFDELWDATNILPCRQMSDRLFKKLIAAYEKEANRPGAWNGKWRDTKRMVLPPLKKSNRPGSNPLACSKGAVSFLPHIGTAVL